MKNALILAVFLCVEGCSAIYHHSDRINPCSNGDKAECEKWKKTYPKEYDRYIERVAKSAEVKPGLSEAASIESKPVHSKRK